MTTVLSVVHSDPDILGGAPVFVGTRVPLRTLIDYLGGGQPLAEFLEDFPTVTRDQAVAARNTKTASLYIDWKRAISGYNSWTTAGTPPRCQNLVLQGETASLLITASK